MKFEPRARGFTLIELMITVAIVAILAKVGLGVYQDSVLKAKRAQGRTAVVELLLQEERYLTQRNCYLAFTVPSGTPTAGSSCGVTPSFGSANPFPFKHYSGESAANSAYLLAAGACGTTPMTDCVQVTATPQFTDPAVNVLQATSTGTKTCTGTASSSNPKLCWP